jgi:hypothetical protein
VVEATILIEIIKAVPLGKIIQAYNCPYSTDDNPNIKDCYKAIASTLVAAARAKEFGLFKPNHFLFDALIQFNCQLAHSSHQGQANHHSAKVV